MAEEDHSHHDVLSADQETDPERCTKQSAQIVRQTAKCHSHLQKEDQYTAKTAGQSEELSSSLAHIFFSFF